MQTLAAAHPGPHQPTPTNRPSWYGDRVGREERSWFSKTGDVELFAGNTFATSFSRIDAAVRHARTASDGEAGAVFVMRVVDPKTHDARYWLTRAYNAEQVHGAGLVVGQTQLDGREKGFSNFHPEVAALADAKFVLKP